MARFTTQERFWATTLGGAGAAALFTNVVGLANRASRWVLTQGNLWRMQAYHSPAALITGTLFALTLFFFLVYSPVVTGMTLWQRWTFPRWTDTPPEPYPAILAHWLATLPTSPAALTPAHRRDLVRVLQAFEAETRRLLALPPGASCRMLWVVSFPEHPQRSAQIWARRADRLTPTEEAVVNQCLHVHGWFLMLTHIAQNPVFAGLAPEHLDTLITARGLHDAHIGFVVAVDRPLRITPTHLDRLKAHMLTITPLWSLALVQTLMVQLTREDWRI